MFSPLHTCGKQRIVIEFLFLQAEIVTNIHRMSVNVYRKTALDISTVRRLFSRTNDNPREKEGTDLSDRLHNGSLTAAVNENKANQADVLISVDRSITIAKLSESLMNCPLIFTEICKCL